MSGILRGKNVVCIFTCFPFFVLLWFSILSELVILWANKSIIFNDIPQVIWPPKNREQKVSPFLFLCFPFSEYLLGLFVYLARRASFSLRSFFCLVHYWAPFCVRLFVMLAFSVNLYVGLVVAYHVYLLYKMDQPGQFFLLFSFFSNRILERKTLTSTGFELDSSEQWASTLTTRPPHHHSIAFPNFESL